MSVPAFSSIQQRAELAALRRLANARLLVGTAAFDCLLVQESHPLGLYGEMGELRNTMRLARADMPAGVVRGAAIDWDTASYTPAEIAAKSPAAFHVDAIEPYGAHGVKVWLR